MTAETGDSKRWLRNSAIVLALSLIVVAATGLGQLRLNSHYTAYFDHDDPLLLEHRGIAARFDRHDSVFVVLHSEDASFADEQRYRLIESASLALARLPNTVDVLSIADLGIVGEVETADGSFIPSIEQLNSHDRAVGLLLSEDAHWTGIQVEFRLPDNSSSTVLDALRSVRETMSIELDGQPVTAHFTGTLALNEAYISVVRHDLGTIVPLLLIVMFVVLSWLLSIRSAAITILPVGLSSVAASFGLAGWFGAELAAVNSFVPVIILSISLAGCVHLSLSYSHYRREGLDPAESATQSVRFNLLPMSLANLTTALGFLGLAFSPSPPIRIVGYVVATGIAVSFTLCILVLPVLQARFDPWSPARKDRSFATGQIASAIARNRKAIIILYIIATVPAIWFASRNVISDNVFEYFAETHPYHRDTSLVEQHFSGVNELVFELDFGEADAVFDAATIETVARFATWLEQQPETIRVSAASKLTVVEDARRNGRLQERLDNYREMSRNNESVNPIVRSEVSEDYSAVLVAAYLEPLDSARIVDFDQRVSAWAAENMPDVGTRRGGPALMFAYLGEKNITGMVFALSAALLLAAVVLGAVLHSARIAWIGLVCNILPVLLVYSVWAVTNGRISIGAAVVMGMILGIVLDDTIYLLSTYRRGLAAGEQDPIAFSLRRIGPALFVTTITLIAGLALGLLSVFGPIWSMSALSVAIIATALVTDLTLLPSLLPRRPRIQ